MAINNPDELPKGINVGARRHEGAEGDNGVDATVDVNRIKSPVNVTLNRPDMGATSDQALWVAIRNRTEAIAFERYTRFIDRVLRVGGWAGHGGAVHGPQDEQQIGAPSLKDRRADLINRPTIYGADAYNLLKFATEVFLLLEAGVTKSLVEDGHVRHKLIDDDPGSYSPTAEGRRLNGPADLPTIEALLTEYFGDSPQLPYLRRVLANIDATLGEAQPFSAEYLHARVSAPSLIELIWSYWHEEGMLVQTMKAIALRFENRRGPAGKDPLANLELDPLRPLNNLLWGYIQDEYRQITVLRRAYEYDHHYGLSLVGRAVPAINGADSRSKFIEAFHNLLHRASKFFKEDSDTTVIADGFPLLNALREVHLLLAEGAHNQFGDLPWAARVQMLTEQWLLARPEMQDFLRGRYMVPYQEGWMGAVDTMKRLQGWTDVTITHFYNLAVYGERVLLSIRYGNWNDVNNSHDQAKNWARYWRPEMQGYVHAYSAVTGVDLSVDVTNPQDAAVRYAQPSILLSRRLAGNRARPALGVRPPGAMPQLPAPASSAAPQLPGPASNSAPPARVRRSSRRQ